MSLEIPEGYECRSNQEPNSNIVFKGLLKNIHASSIRNVFRKRENGIEQPNFRLCRCQKNNDKINASYYNPGLF